MSIIDQQQTLESFSDGMLVQEAQAPSGQYPQFLVISELERRKNLRGRYQAEQQKKALNQPTVVEKRIAEMAGIPAVDPVQQQPVDPRMQQGIAQAPMQAPMQPQMPPPGPQMGGAPPMPTGYAAGGQVGPDGVTPEWRARLAESLRGVMNSFPDPIGDRIERYGYLPESAGPMEGLAGILNTIMPGVDNLRPIRASDLGLGSMRFIWERPDQVAGRTFPAKYDDTTELNRNLLASRGVEFPEEIDGEDLRDRLTKEFSYDFSDPNVANLARSEFNDPIARLTELEERFGGLQDFDEKEIEATTNYYDAVQQSAEQRAALIREQIDKEPSEYEQELRASRMTPEQREAERKAQVLSQLGATISGARRLGDVGVGLGSIAAGVSALGRQQRAEDLDTMRMLTEIEEDREAKNFDYMLRALEAEGVGDQAALQAAVSVSAINSRAMDRAMQISRDLVSAETARASAVAQGHAVDASTRSLNERAVVEARRWIETTALQIENALKSQGAFSPTAVASAMEQLRMQYANRVTDEQFTDADRARINQMIESMAQLLYNNAMGFVNPGGITGVPTPGAGAQVNPSAQDLVNRLSGN